jgi:hypothetical protein
MRAVYNGRVDHFRTSAGTVTKLRAVHPRNRGSVPNRDENFFYSYYPECGVRLASGTVDSFPGVKRSGYEANHSLRSTESNSAWNLFLFRHKCTWRGLWVISRCLGGSFMLYRRVVIQHELQICVRCFENCGSYMQSRPFFALSAKCEPIQNVCSRARHPTPA